MSSDPHASAPLAAMPWHPLAHGAVQLMRTALLFGVFSSLFALLWPLVQPPQLIGRASLSVSQIGITFFNAAMVFIVIVLPLVLLWSAGARQGLLRRLALGGLGLLLAGLACFGFLYVELSGAFLTSEFYSWRMLGFVLINALSSLGMLCLLALFGWFIQWLFWRRISGVLRLAGWRWVEVGALALLASGLGFFVLQQLDLYQLWLGERSASGRYLSIRDAAALRAQEPIWLLVLLVFMIVRAGVLTWLRSLGQGLLALSVAALGFLALECALIFAAPVFSHSWALGAGLGVNTLALLAALTVLPALYQRALSHRSRAYTPEALADVF